MFFTFSRIHKGLTYAVLLLCISIFVSGCSNTGAGGDTTALDVILETSVLSQNNGKKPFRPPTEADKFHVEVLEESGVEKYFREVENDPLVKNLTVAFQLKTGNYRVRVSAFDSDNTILGTFNKPVVINQGENTIYVRRLDSAQLYFTPNLNLPQTRSPKGLSDFLSFNQSGIHLQSYCIWGKLVEEGKPENAYLGIVQRMDQLNSNYGTHHLSNIIGGVGYNNEQTAQIIFGGVLDEDDLTGLVTLTQPWHVNMESLNSPSAPFPYNTVDMMLLNGEMGRPGAQYKITSRTVDLKGGALETSLVVTDSMGFVNEGYGPASFFPQWILPSQRSLITGKIYNGSVGEYLNDTGDPMTDQGSYYYSAPMLEVDSYSIVRNGEVVSKGSDGLLWMDVVYQSFDSAALSVVKTATWEFFSLQFPQRNQALMVTRVRNDQNGEIPVASLFSTNATRSANGALNPEHRWNLQEIDIKPIPGHTWTSPTTNLIYNTKYNITLGGTRKANLVVTMAWNEQEIQDGNTAKYEGLADVSGTIDGEAVNGSAWVELQPAGRK